jgi:UDP-GlcNAc:undecaprenyl-phosphate GlcNAc-1-phosphate transferase
VNPWLIALVIGGSAVLSTIVVDVSIRMSHRVAAYDHPDGERKTQERPIPKLGGVAVALAVTTSVVAVLLVTSRFQALGLALSVLFPALLAALIGFLDDRQALTPYLRLAMQAGVAALAWLLGTRLTITGIVALDAALLVLWVLVLINGINLLDNSDGLAGATVLISSFGAAVIAVMYGQILVSILGFAIAGVTVGFLWHNWFPAKVYMGDAGAYFLGFLLAILTVRLKPTGAPVLVGVVIAILLVLVPLFDTTFVVINRLRQGIHPFTAGRDHLSHVLQGRNLSVAWSVAALQLLGVAGVGGAVILAAAYR